MAQGKDTKPATKLTSAGRRKEWTGIPGQPGGVVNPPVWRASTHLYEDSADLEKGRPNEDGHFYYGRRGAPTQWALAEALTELEPGAAGTQLYPSGVAAIAGALLSVLRAGDVLLMTDKAYQPSRAMAETSAFATCSGSGVSRVSSGNGVSIFFPNASAKRPAMVVAAFTVIC